MRGVKQVIQMLSVATPIIDVEPEVINMARNLIGKSADEQYEGLQEISDFMVESQEANTFAIYAVRTELVHGFYWQKAKDHLPEDILRDVEL